MAKIIEIQVKIKTDVGHKRHETTKQWPYVAHIGTLWFILYWSYIV